MTIIKGEVNKLVKNYCTSSTHDMREPTSPVFLIQDGTIGTKPVFKHDNCNKNTTYWEYCQQQN